MRPETAARSAVSPSGSRHADLNFGYDEMFSSIKRILIFTSREALVSDIKEALENSPEDDGNYDEDYCCRNKPSYLLISGNDYSDTLPGHIMIPQDEYVIPDMKYQRAYYLLFGQDPEYGCVHEHAEINPRFYGDRIIFLDIDGVLNDDVYDGHGNHEYFNEKMVKELSRLIRRTKARVVLSSSWRRAFISHIRYGTGSNEEIFDRFLEFLEREKIRIDGMTPDAGMQGSMARPLEIRTWHSRYPEIESFVILDDDTFWNWGYLRQNVVTTITRIPDEETSESEKKKAYPRETRDGLTRELADKAAQILLRKNDACIMRKD